MKVKKLLIIGLCLLMVFAVAACGSEAAAPEESAEPEVAVPFEKHSMAYPESYDLTASGATSYDGCGDNFESPYYAHPDFYNMESTDSLTIIPNWETYQQSTEYSCGASSALMVLNHYGVTDYDEMTIVDLADVSDQTGVGVTGVSKFFTDLGWNVETNRDGNYELNPYAAADDPNNFTNFVTSHLAEGTPIMVDWIDWAGHWQVIIGYDKMGTPDHFGDDVIIVADPYDTTDHYQDGYYIVPAERFFYMWTEGYGIFEGEGGPEVNPWVIATPAE